MVRVAVWCRAWLIAGLLLGASTAAAQDRLRAEEFRSELTVLQDGSVQVVESIRFRFSGKTFEEVTRTVPVRRTDGVIDVTASLDGQVLPEGRSDNQVRIEARRRELRVRWRFPDVTDTTRTFTLAFRAMGALRVERERVSLLWHVLPSRHDYAIDQAVLVLRIPDGVVSLDGPALESQGWAWFRRDDGAWEARKANLAKDETAVLTDVFVPRGFAVSVPAWQALEERTREMTPAFLVGAAVVLIMGLGIVAMVYFRYHRPAPDRERILPAERQSLPAGIATALRGSRVHTGMLPLSATLFDLLSRAVLRLEETSPSGTKDHKRTFDLVVPERSSPSSRRLLPHEQVVLDLLWPHVKQGRVDMKTAQRALAKGVKQYGKAVRAEIVAAGYLDSDREAASHGLLVAGLLAVLLGGACAVGLGLLEARLGELAPVVGIAMLVVGVILIIAGAVFPTVSATGAEVSAAWGARLRAINEMIKRGATAAEVDEWLPVAIGMGLGQAMSKTGVAVTWLAGMHNPAAVLPLIIATSGAASPGGMPGGGVGGGGFSGAR